MKYCRSLVFVLYIAQIPAFSLCCASKESRKKLIVCIPATKDTAVAVLVIGLASGLLVTTSLFPASATEPFRSEVVDTKEASIMQIDPFRMNKSKCSASSSVPAYSLSPKVVLPKQHKYTDAASKQVVIRDRKIKQSRSKVSQRSPLAHRTGKMKNQ